MSIMRTGGDSDAATVSNPANVRRLEGMRHVSESSHDFEGWKIIVLKSPILPSNCYCDHLDAQNTKGLVLETGQGWEEPLTGVVEGGAKPVTKCQVCRYGEELHLKHLPEMVFPDNILHLEYKSSGFVLQFNTLEAMKLMSTTDTNSVRVTMAEAWQASKVEMGLPKDILHDFNWTFTTEYKGTLKGRVENSASYSPESSFRVETDVVDKLNLQKLMLKEQILFFEELTLFEDELHDNGISNCSVKIRVMPSGFFVLLRYFLRVDHVMAKVCDTRIHFETGNKYFLRQYQCREESFKNLGNLDPHIFSDINVLYNHLPIRMEATDKIFITQ